MITPTWLKQRAAARGKHEGARACMQAWEAWLAPIPPMVDGDVAVGRDPAHEDAFFAIKDEVERMSAADDALIVRSCEQLLKTVGKDVRLAGFYTFARVRLDGAVGLADGLELTAALLLQFGEDVLPARAEARRAGLAWLASTRLLDQLDRHPPMAADVRQRALGALQQLLDAVSSWDEAMRPGLQPLLARLAVSEEATSVPAIRVGDDGAALVAGVAAIGSSRDVLAQSRALADFLRTGPGGYLPAARLLRCVRWDTLQELPPADRKRRTRLPSPRAELVRDMERLLLQKQWNALRDRADGAFMEAANHLWLDLAWFQYRALSETDAVSQGWLAPMRADLALLLERLPGLEQLRFVDGQPFASDATLRWIEAEVVAAPEAFRPASFQAANAGAGETDVDWPGIETEAFALLASDGLDGSFAWLASLPGMAGERPRFYRHWLMARLAEAAGRMDTAGYLLDDLDATIDRLGLAVWEPALVFDVKSHALAWVRRSLAAKAGDRGPLTLRLHALQRQLTMLDPARAVLPG